MKTLFKVSLVALFALTCAALSANPHRWYQCADQPDILYRHYHAAQAACPDSKIYVAHHPYRVYYRNGDGYYYYDYDYPHGVVGEAVEGAHDIASNVWHGIFG